MGFDLVNIKKPGGIAIGLLFLKVWNAHPLFSEVHVFENTGAALIHRGDELCSADAVIPGFAIPVSEIFKEA